MMSNSQLSTAKTFYEQQGNPREVLLSYEVYREMLRAICELAAETDQAYFWTEQWQAMERAADEAAAQGQFRTFDTMDEMLDFLDAQ